MAVLSVIVITAVFLFPFYNVPGLPKTSQKKWTEFLNRNLDNNIFPEFLLPKLLIEKNSGSDGFYKVKIDKRIIEKLNLKFGFQYDPTGKYPLLKKKVFKKEFPFPRTGKYIQKPNVIIIFMESLCADFVSVYNRKRTGLTPSLEKLSRNASVFHNFYNSSTPTFNGVLSTVSSYLPPMNTYTWTQEFSDSIKMTGLPKILINHGYECRYVIQESKHYVNMGKMLESTGFVVDDAEDIKNRLEEEPLSRGYSDHQIMRYLVALLKGHGLREPFLLSAATIDLHPPFNLWPDCTVYNKRESTIINLIYSSDHALGRFLEYFFNSPYKDNTILVVLADHSCMPGKEHASIRNIDISRMYYDRIPLMIYDPMHELPEKVDVYSSQIDVAPTLLHILGINGINNFEGLSIFDDRADYPDIISLEASRFSINQRKGKKRDIIDINIHDREKYLTTAEPAEVKVNGPLTPEELYQWYLWKKYLHKNNLLWP